MLKYEKSNVAGEGPSRDVSGSKEGQPIKGNEGVGVGSGGPGKRAGECRSITLHGDGDHSGKDINNAMSLGDFYRRFVCVK